MQNLFETKVRYEKVDEQSGKQTKVTETYLLDAVSHTEAESRIFQEMESIIRGEFYVKAIRPANYTEVFENEDGDTWYRSKISFASVDEKSGKEKKVSNQILVLANSVKDAFDKIHEGMGGMTVDFEIDSIIKSPILEFFPYFNNGLKAYRVEHEEVIYIVAAASHEQAPIVLEMALEQTLNEYELTGILQEEWASTMLVNNEEGKSNYSLAELMRESTESRVIGTTAD